MTARRQLGLVTSHQLTQLGWSEYEVDNAVTRARLFRVRRGVYRAAGAAVTREEQSWLAAVLAASDDAVLSHGSDRRWRCSGRR